MYFDFSMTYIGAGLICPHIVNISVLLGAIVSWGLMWPLIQNHEGDWYPAGLKSYDFKGLYGYKVISPVSTHNSLYQLSMAAISYSTSCIFFSLLPHWLPHSTTVVLVSRKLSYSFVQGIAESVILIPQGNVSEVLLLVLLFQYV